MVPKELFFFSGKTNKRYHFVVVVVIVMLLYTRKRSNEKEENLFAFAICNYLLKTKKKNISATNQNKSSKRKGKKATSFNVYFIVYLLFANLCHIFVTFFRNFTALFFLHRNFLSHW